MADNKNNLEDFFKNRINDFDELNDGWDLPDESAWENAQTHFPKHPQKKTSDWKLGALILLAFALIAAGSYIYFLKKDLSKKSNQLELAKIEIENNNATVNTISDLEIQLKNKNQEIEEYKIKHQNSISSLVDQQQFSTKTILSQQKIIQDLQNENQELIKKTISVQSDFASESESNISPNENFVPNISKKNSNEIVENVIPIAFSSMKIKNNFPTQKLDLESEFNVIFPKSKKETGKFELGLNYTFMNYEMPISYDFEKLEKDDFDEDNYAFSIPTKGGRFQMSYSIRPDFWITTGFRRTTGGFEKSFSDKLIYDKSGEYIDDEGKTINEFDITTQTGFSDAGSNIDFEIPNGTIISDGEFLETEWNYSQQYKFTHIPIGVNYFMGKNKLKWFLTGGLGWNKVSLGEYFVEAQLSYDNEILPIKANEESKKIEVSSQFINGFAGAGLNYQLTSNWNARTSFTLEKNFIQKSEILESNSLTKVFDIGLNFRF